MEGVIPQQHEVGKERKPAPLAGGQTALKRFGKRHSAPNSQHPDAAAAFPGQHQLHPPGESPARLLGRTRGSRNPLGCDTTWGKRENNQEKNNKIK